MSSVLQMLYSIFGAILLASILSIATLLVRPPRLCIVSKNTTESATEEEDLPLIPMLVAIPETEELLDDAGRALTKKLSTRFSTTTGKFVGYEECAGICIYVYAPLACGTWMAHTRHPK
jgi:hypothetical protein